MWTRFSVAAHLSADEVKARYRAAHDPVARWRWQMIWLLISGRSLAEVAAVTGYSPRWIREVVRHYNEEGAEALADRRHDNAGAAPLLDEDGRQALEEALHRPPPEGGRWTGAKAAAWIARHLGRERVAPQRGRDYLRRTGRSLQVPRPRHTEAADAAAQAAFQKTSMRSLKKSVPAHPGGRSRCGPSTSTGPG